jgi:Rap1a immunity proteins
MPFLIPLLFLSLAPTPTTPSKDTTHLYDSCKAFDRVLDNDQHPHDLDIADYCVGYMKGYFGGISAASENAGGLCASQATLGTLARVYTVYMNNNPKLFDEPQEVGFHGAMMTNYSCSKNSNP